MKTNVAYTLNTIHLHEATLDEKESWLFLQYYNTEKKFHSVYKCPDMEFDKFQILSSSFALFYAKITNEKEDISFPSNYPLNVFRYMMMPDGSWSYYDTVKRQPGYVVEGAYWSNGMIYQVRSDSRSDFTVHEMTLSVDMLTKTMYNFPD